jgi:hypothetical protein
MLSKLSRRRLIELFIKHRYLYNQGNNTLAQLAVIPVEKIAIVAATAKYLIGDHVSMTVIYIAGGTYLCYRVFIRWFIGFLWHKEDAYDLETEWNRGKVPPSRVEVINCEEIAKCIKEETK